MIRILLLLKKSLLIVFCAAIAVNLCGCMPSREAQMPEIPTRLEKNADGVPMLNVYDAEKKSVERMDIETYVMGVVAGEMRSDWPLEALKAQAILARTFTMKFLTDKTSRYDGADISTDVQEAQAYNAANINDRVREAVNATRGIVMTDDGAFVNAWFHAHSGGMTEMPSKALEYSNDPGYLRAVESRESADAPDEVKNWVAEFTPEQVERACEEAGVKTGAVKSVEIGSKGESGRAVTLLVNGREVSAPTFRIRIDASKLKSTLIDSISIADGNVIFKGRGFGHGVGMSQWGAYAMAKAGKNADAIINHYFNSVELNRLW